MTAVVETSPAGDTRERAVACAICSRPTWNVSGRCDKHLEPATCQECGRIWLGPGRLCTPCRRTEDGPYDDEDDR